MASNSSETVRGSTPEPQSGIPGGVLLEQLLKDMEKAERINRRLLISLCVCATALSGGFVWSIYTHRVEFSSLWLVAGTLVLSSVILLFFAKRLTDRLNIERCLRTIQIQQANDSLELAKLIHKLQVGLPGEPGQKPAKIPMPPSSDND